MNAGESRHLPPAVEAMTRPDFYPHEVRGEVRLTQTHCSYVLLTGLYAYKVKKPVDFGFLDFTTLAKRKRVCEDELRLNRRFSQDLYLEVVPISRSDHGAFHLGGQGETVEYALKMREFPQSALFSRMFEKDKLETEHLQGFGRLLAELHERAPTDHDIAHYGAVDQVRQVAEDNYRASEPYLGVAQTEARLRQTRAYTERFFSEHANWFARRQRDGKVRECHGDLHLNNIFLDDGRIQVFDCIEFNRAFRCIDVIYDAAFLLVDLEVRGRRDLAYAFINAYLETSGDYFGAAMLPLYASIRAYVKAKVVSLLLDDEHLTDDEHDDARRQAEAYYRLAWDHAHGRRGEIWVSAGLSGAGKSTVAAWLAQQAGAVHIRSDAVRKHIADAPLHERADASLYTPEMSARVYQRLADLALLLAGLGLSVVLDAKYDRRRFRDELTERAHTADIPIQFIRCHAPLDVLRERIARRDHDISDATPELVAAQHEAEQPFGEAERPYVVTLDTTRDWRKAMTRFLDDRQASLCEN